MNDGKKTTLSAFLQLLGYLNKCSYWVLIYRGTIIVFPWEQVQHHVTDTDVVIPPFGHYVKFAYGAHGTFNTNTVYIAASYIYRIVTLLFSFISPKILVI